MAAASSASVRGSWDGIMVAEVVRYPLRLPISTRMVRTSGRDGPFDVAWPRGRIVLVFMSIFYRVRPCCECVHWGVSTRSLSGRILDSTRYCALPGAEQRRLIGQVVRALLARTGSGRVAVRGWICGLRVAAVRRRPFQTRQPSQNISDKTYLFVLRQDNSHRSAGNQLKRQTCNHCHNEKMYRLSE